ncbi:hypothetical protein DFH27DRAFT_605281 [Peziza echinospora]|nr:hypothetical protein DFH27DRAFT_605281 [Peziza echinospora]
MSDNGSSIMGDFHCVYDGSGRLRQEQTPSRVYASERGSISWMDSESAFSEYLHSRATSSHKGAITTDRNTSAGNASPSKSPLRRSPHTDMHHLNSSRNSFSSISSSSTFERPQFNRRCLTFPQTFENKGQHSPTLQRSNTYSGNSSAQSPIDPSMAIRSRYPALRSPRGSVHRLSARSIASIKSVMEGTVMKPRPISPKFQTLGPVSVSVEEEEDEEEQEGAMIRRIDIAREYFVGEEVITPSGQKVYSLFDVECGENPAHTFGKALPPATSEVAFVRPTSEKKKKTVRMSRPASPGSDSVRLEENILIDKPTGQKKAIRFSDSPLTGEEKGAAYQGYPRRPPPVKQSGIRAPEPTPLVLARPQARVTVEQLQHVRVKDTLQPAPAPLSLYTPAPAPLVPKIKVSRFSDDMELVARETCILSSAGNNDSKSVRIYAREASIDRETRKYRKTPTPAGGRQQQQTTFKSKVASPAEGNRLIPRQVAEYLSIPPAYMGTPPAAPNPPKSKKSVRMAGLDMPPRQPAVQFFLGGGGPRSIPSRPVSPGSMSTSSEEEDVPIDSRFLRYRSPRPGMRMSQGASPARYTSGSSGSSSNDHTSTGSDQSDDDDESLYEFGTGASTPVASVGTSACPIEINRRRFLRDMEKRVEGVQVSGRAHRVNYHRRNSDTPGPLCSSSSTTSSSSSLTSYESDSDCYEERYERSVFSGIHHPWTMEDICDISSTTEIRTTAALHVKNDIVPKPNYLAPLLGDWNRKRSTDTQIRVLFQEEMRRWSDEDVYSGLMDGNGEDEDVQEWIPSPAPLMVGWDRPRL